ncbi:hypothetical protein PtA15_5A467 [Puccinia triticina]|uniref:Uncharacterized protein n=1 Tax=Puccinia triticina TaxID=208348 RepID=A0ABY7CJP4_9BASI|nr:uncharacterized protein PtA15_5A467 [Puccinia triticina]WAQ84894.1 hypothetical protein PtA15_5A467 [Puccinia triticina]WAR58239.1 hypothetical protein PtB15_5B472 [Puccinia triticina]
MHTLPSPKGVAPTTGSQRQDEVADPMPSGSDLGNATLASQPTSVKRRDSGLTKEDTEDGLDESQPSQDQGWEKHPVAKKKRVRAELNAVSEDHAPSAHPTGLAGQELAVGSLSGAGLREVRRARKELDGIEAGKDHGAQELHQHLVGLAGGVHVKHTGPYHP